MQSSADEEPVLTVLRPLLQEVQDVWPPRDVYSPLGQATQLLPSEYVPAEHSTEEEDISCNTII